MSCNVNNGTEYLNLDLKYEELDGYKNCVLSKLLTVIIEEFILKLYRNYVTMTLRFISKHKKYLENIPSFLKDRPRALVTDILDKISRATDEMRSSVEESIKNIFMVKSASDNSKIDIQILAGKKTFTDLSVLYLEHRLTNLDEDLLQNFQENEGPRQVDSANSGRFLTLSFFLGHVTGVYAEESVEGDRLV